MLAGIHILVSQFKEPSDCNSSKSSDLREHSLGEEALGPIKQTKQNQVKSWLCYLLAQALTPAGSEVFFVRTHQ